MSDQASNRRPESSSGNLVHDQTIALLKEGIRGKIPSSKIADLRRKLNNDEQVDAIQTAFYDNQRESQHRAKKFVKFIQEKFRSKNYPLHTILKEADRYKEKNKLTDLEFAEFKYQYERLMTSKSDVNHNNLLPSTNMALLFGDLYSVEGLVVKDSDYAALDDILKLHTMTRGTHSQVILQSMQYENFPAEVREAQYDATRHNLPCAMSPVLAAMFAPKLKGFEDHFLFTNIAYIVKCKYEKKKITTMSDIFLLNAMIVDSNDVVCSDKSPIADLRMRANIQNNLWNCVLQMRTGKFFECVGNDFFTSIEECKIYRQDSPDLIYTGDECIIMKRLLTAMSFNPIILTTQAVFGVGGNANPIGFPIIDNSIVCIPYFTVRLPDASNTSSSEELSLEDSISRVQVYKEDGMFIPKKQKILQIMNNVLIFHVPRRSIAAIDSYMRLIDPRPKFTQIPSHVLINERLNDFKINYSEMLTIDDKTFSFVSGVTLETPKYIQDGTEEAEENKKIIIGSAAVVRNSGPDNRINFGAEYFIYSPKMLGVRPATIIQSNTNIRRVWEDITNEANDLLAQKGTIFIYEKNV